MFRKHHTRNQARVFSMRWIRNTEIYGLSSCTSQVITGAFHSTKIPVTVRYDCTDPTQATARLVIVLVSRMQKRGTGNNNFVKRKGTFRFDRPKCLDHWSWIRANRNGPFHLKYQPKFPEFGVEWKALYILIIIIHSKYFSVSE